MITSLLNLHPWSENLSNSESICCSYPDGRSAPYYHTSDRLSHLYSDKRVCNSSPLAKLDPGDKDEHWCWSSSCEKPVLASSNTHILLSLAIFFGPATCNSWLISFPYIFFLKIQANSPQSVTFLTIADWLHLTHLKQNTKENCWLSLTNKPTMIKEYFRSFRIWDVLLDFINF